MTVTEGVVLFDPAALNYSPQALLPLLPCSDPPIIAAAFSFSIQPFSAVSSQTPPMVDFESGFKLGSASGSVTVQEVTRLGEGYLLGTAVDEANDITDSAAAFLEGYALSTKTVEVVIVPVEASGPKFPEGYGLGSALADDEFQAGYQDGVAESTFITNTAQSTPTPTTSVYVLTDSGVSDEEYDRGYDDGVASATTPTVAVQSVSPTPTPPASSIYVVNIGEDEDYQSGYDDGIAAAVFVNSQPILSIPIFPTTISRRTAPRGIIMTTPRFKWPIPTRNIDDWYDPFVNLSISVDTSTFANTEDRNALCMGGGTFEFTLSSGLLTWDDTIEILSANTGFVRSIVAGSLILGEGDLFFVELHRYPTDNAIIPALKASNLSVISNINDSFVLAVRRNNLIYFRNGRNMQDGDSFKVFETTGTGSSVVSTSAPISGNGTPGSPVTIAANAITNAKLAQMPTQTLKGNNTGGAATPADLTAVQVKALLGIGPLSGLGLFGDGSDGTATMDGVSVVTGATLVSGVYTAQRECFYNNLTINPGIVWKPDGWPQYVKGTLTNNGQIDSNGGAGGTSLVGGVGTGGDPAYTGARVLPLPAVGVSGAPGQGSGFPGLNSTQAPQGFSNTGGVGGVGGTAGTPGANGTSGGPGKGGGGGASGSTIFSGTSAGSGGTVTAVANFFGSVRAWPQYYSGRNLTGGQMSSGSSGGSAAGSMQNPAFGGGGGGSGSAGGWVVLHVFEFAGSGTYQAKGGNGGAGSLSTTGQQAGSGGGGGGGGGVFIIHTASANPPTPDVSGGIGGIGQPGVVATTLKGGDGGNGGDGIVVIVN